MATDTALTPVDLSEYTFDPQCHCGKPSEYLAKGCMDKEPVGLCDDCYRQAITRLVTYLRLWQRVNKRVMICGDCYRPIINLDTHLEVTYLCTPTN